MVLYLVTLTTAIGLATIVLPFVLKYHKRCLLLSMIITCICYIISTIAIGIFYIKVGSVSTILISIGKFDITFQTDPLCVAFSSLVAIMWLLSIIYTEGYIRPKYQLNLFISAEVMHAFIGLCVITANLTILAGNLFTTLIFYEILTLCTLPLVYSGSMDALKDYFRPLIYPSLLLFLPIAMYIMNTEQGTVYESIILFAALLFGVSKLALVPFHQWLPTAMIAPHPVSALLHAVAVVNTGVFVMCKILVYQFANLMNFTLGAQYLVVIPGITILYSGIKAIMAEDIKRMLAYSTMNHLALCVLGICLLSKASIASVVALTIAHSFAKIALFFIVGNIFLITRKSKFSELEGIFYQMPLSIILFTLSAASLIGIPLTAGYISKSLLGDTASESGNMPAVVLMVIGSIMTFIYMLKTLYIFYINRQNQRITPIKKCIDYVEYRTNVCIILPILVCQIPIFGFSYIAEYVKRLMGFL